MSEPVEVDGLPVQLTPGRQKRWDTGDDAEREKIRDEIRKLRRKDDPPEGVTWDRPTSFDDVTRQHGEP
jgi:hypothetical protein